MCCQSNAVSETVTETELVPKGFDMRNRRSSEFLHSIDNASDKIPKKS